jgi:hypothetical protein
MATGNFVALASTTHSTSGSYSAGGLASPANPTYAYDGDTGTYFGCYDSHGAGGDWGWTAYLISSHHFSTPRAISSIVYKLRAVNTTGGEYPNGSYYMYVQISYNGTDWTTIYSTSGGYGNDFTINTSTAGTWNSVTDIRAIVYSNSGGDREGATGAFIYDLQAVGTIYSDIGLRIRKNGVTYNIGVETLVDAGAGAHKLRFRDGGTTYGIPLLSVSDINASTLRIYDGANTKALPLATA